METQKETKFLVFEGTSQRGQVIVRDFGRENSLGRYSVAKYPMRGRMSVSYTQSEKTALTRANTWLKGGQL